MLTTLTAPIGIQDAKFDADPYVIVMPKPDHPGHPLQLAYDAIKYLQEEVKTKLPSWTIPVLCGVAPGNHSINYSGNLSTLTVQRTTADGGQVLSRWDCPLMAYQAQTMSLILPQLPKE